jgi:hypothetical protein
LIHDLLIKLYGYMKQLKLFLIILLLAGVFSVNAMGMDGRSHQNQNRGRQHHGSVGAPLDGGLLTVLGAAGIAYYAAKKKNKNLGL